MLFMVVFLFWGKYNIFMTVGYLTLGDQKHSTFKSHVQIIIFIEVNTTVISRDKAPSLLVSPTPLTVPRRAVHRRGRDDLHGPHPVTGATPPRVHRLLPPPRRPDQLEHDPQEPDCLHLHRAAALPRGFEDQAYSCATGGWLGCGGFEEEKFYE